MFSKRSMWVAASVLIVASVILSACATPTPEVVEKLVTQIVKETVKETVIVEGTPQVVEKEVTKVVEKVVTKEVEVVVKETVLVEEPKPKLLAVGVGFGITTLDPSRVFEHAGRTVMKATYNTLVTWPDEGISEIVPDLAESWEASEDGTVFTFHLRKGVEFQSGNTLTAEDVKWTLERVIGLKGNPAWLLDGVVSVETPDDYTVVITKDGPDPAFLAKMTNPALSILDRKTVMEHGGTSGPDAAETDKAEPWLNQNSAGTGPYILKRWADKYEVVVEKFPDYWRGPAYFDKVVYRHLPEAATQKLTLEAGDIDIAIEITMDQADELRSNPDIKVLTGPSVDTWWLVCNMNPELTPDGVCANEKVRMAMKYAMDYEGYKKLFHGITPATVVASGLGGAWGPDRAFTRDLDKAKALLAEAGYPDGFEIDLYAMAERVIGGVAHEDVAEKAQADLAEIGIKANLKPTERTVILADHREGEVGFLVWMTSVSYYDIHAFTVFLPGVGFQADRAQWTEERADQEILDLRDAVMNEMDPDKRLELWDQIQEYWQIKSARIPVVQPQHAYAVRSDIKGFVFNLGWRVDPYILSREE